MSTAASRRPDPTFSVETITDYPSLADLQETWDRTHQASGSGNPFLTHDWILSWWEAFGEGKKLHIMVFKSEGETVAIAPFMWTTERIAGIRVRCLRLIYNDHTPRMDFIIDRHAQGAYGAIWRQLAGNTRWHVLRLNQLSEYSPAIQEFCRNADLDRMPWGIWLSSESPYLPLAGDWETYLRNLTAKHRSNLRNRDRRLRELGLVTRETITSGSNLVDTLEEGFRIEAAGWKGNRGTAINCRPELRQFYISVARRFSNRGSLRLEFLNVAGRRIAFAYMIRYESRLHLLKIGYDPEFSNLSPFNLLCEILIREAHEEGLSEFDFLGDSAKWKLDWTRSCRRHYWLYVFRDTLFCRLLHRIKFQWIPNLRLNPMAQKAFRHIR